MPFRSHRLKAVPVLTFNRLVHCNSGFSDFFIWRCTVAPQATILVVGKASQTLAVCVPINSTSALLFTSSASCGTSDLRSPFCCRCSLPRLLRPRSAVHAVVARLPRLTARATRRRPAAPEGAEFAADTAPRLFSRHSVRRRQTLCYECLLTDTVRANLDDIGEAAMRADPRPVGCRDRPRG